VTRTTRLVLALALNASLVIAEVLFGLTAHSAALLSDAGHNLTDVIALAISLLAVRWALRPRSEMRSFGNHRGTILAALANAAILGVVTVTIMVISVERLVHPAHVHGGVVAVVAAVALAANLLALLTLHDGTRDHNMRANVVHMAADAGSSAAVLAAGLLIFSVGSRLDRADPIASLVVSVLICVEAARLIAQSADVLLESTPRDVDLGALRAAITGVDAVADVHDLHVWSLSSEIRALSAHLVLSGHPTLEDAQAVGGRVRAQVCDDFGIAHTTFALECERCEDEGDPCDMDEVSLGAGHRTLVNRALVNGAFEPQTRRSPE
jgi:cobalt-zinc-cadmium efflux system protein